MGYLSEARRTSSKRKMAQHGSKWVNKGALTAGLNPVSRIAISSTQMNRSRPGYDSSLSFQRSKMGKRITDEERLLGGQARLMNRMHGIGPDTTPSAYKGAYAERLRAAGIRSDNPEGRRSNYSSIVNERGDLITTQSRRKSYMPIKEEKFTPEILRKRTRGTNYIESPDSRDKTNMTVRTFEGTKDYGRRRANKKTLPSKVFSEGASKVKRSKSVGSKQGRT